jgi:DNA-binding SARP family transcriptional activator
MRTLLGLLVAYANSTLTRDIVLDAMWPESDPGSAINSLNQTVFQLRRAIDPDYRDGDSPMYIISNVDQVQLNPEFVITDLQEYRRFARNVRSNGAHASPAAEATIDLIRGEFLAELRYDDWAQRLQTAIHSEVRATLITIAEGGSTVPADTAVRAACALTELDPYDEAAQIAMARQLDLSGKRVAGRRSLERFIERLERDLDEKASPTLIAALRALGAPSGSNDV